MAQAVSFRNRWSLRDAKRFFQTRICMVTARLRAFNNVAAAWSRRRRVIER
jgi:hypothetical protein